MCEIMERLAAEAKNEGKLEILFSLVKDGILTIAETSKKADMTEAVFTENMKQFQA